jgi:hypothetical protein
MKPFFTSFLLLIVISTYGQFTQYVNIVIDGSGSPEEPSIMIDPENPAHLVAGSNINNYYYSEDGGFTWVSGKLVSPEYGVWGDPCIIVDTAGDFYFFHLSNPQQGNWIDRIVSQKFDFETHSWTDGTYMGLNGTKAQDKEWAIVDRETNTIYVTWTQFDHYGSSNANDSSNIMFSKSTDGGETWTQAKRINQTAGDCEDGDNTVEGAVPAVGPDGEVYVAWAGPLGIMFDKSFDGGETWLDHDIFVSDQPGGWDYAIPGIWRCNGLPATVCDISHSPYQGTIYVNWTDQRNGTDDTDVWIAKSTDGGETWSAPIRVNDDPAGKQQFFSWITVDQANGDVYVVFYDRRNYNDINTDVFIARSTDGGETFNNIKINESPFIPSGNVFFGDYTNIAAHDGYVRPIWARLHDGQLKVLTAIVDISVGMEEQVQKTSDPFTVQASYPNPFKESTNFAFKLNRPSDVTLKVSDITGREVAVLIRNKRLAKGKYTEILDVAKYNMKPGFYYFILQAGNYTKTQKILLSY